MMPNKLSLEDAAEITAGQPADRVNWTALSRDTGLSTDVLMRKLRPGYTARRNEGVRIARQVRRGIETWQMPKRYAGDTVPKADFVARLAEIPRDTRSITGFVFGDPIPGDQRRRY